MGKVVTLAGMIVAGAVAVGSLMACSPFGGASEFHCTMPEECSAQGTAGFCEADGLCSFSDSGCDPSGHRYGELAGPKSGTCVGGTTGVDSGVDMPPDMPPDPGDVCFGAVGGLEHPCWAAADVPTGTLALTADIDTVASGLCSTTVKSTLACVVAAASISIGAGVTIRATGTKQLVLVSTTGAITIDGALDVASHLNITTPGAGSDPNTCDPGTAATTSGGGAGGSFAALGGDGGDGVNVSNSGGRPGVAAVNVTTLRGGCKGQDGKEGTGLANTRGLGGAGGGAVYLIAKTNLTLNAGATINASGAAATGGVNLSAGGGAGGSGGTIGIDTPAFTSGGVIFALGGGGGAGSGMAGTGPSGTDPTALQPGQGGVGGTGGSGGNGGTTGAGSPGADDADRGGGGAGGSTGLVRLFGGATSSGTVSPPAT